MARIIKHPEVRRGDILDAAQTLFLEKGYDATTVADVIAAAGISKGGFYHHFAAKEALIEALAARFAQDAVLQLNGVLDDPVLNAFDKLHAFIVGSRRLRTNAAPTLWAIFGAIYRTENTQLLHRTQAAALEVITPILAGIIAQGVAEQTFDTPDPEDTAEQILALGATTHSVLGQLFEAGTDREAQAVAEVLTRKLINHGIAIDRLLGLPDGSINVVDDEMIDILVAARPVSRLAAGRKG